jgi:hypothetical protein
VVNDPRVHRALARFEVADLKLVTDVSQLAEVDIELVLPGWV